MSNSTLQNSNKKKTGLNRYGIRGIALQNIIIQLSQQFLSHSHIVDYNPVEFKE